jgi:dihydrodiol dehydrogenase / D-xylose 1-dehydrogenase (NADP)
MTTPFRWGILGTGSIARQFAKGLRALPDAALVAVGSRGQASAEAFARAHGAARAHGSYQALAADPGIDAIYVATPHPLHAENAVLCLDHGKAVLCEKPFAVNAAQAERMAEAARRNGRFLMEAMWTRFLPVTRQVAAWLAEGAIGEVRQLNADFGFRCGWDPDSRLLSPALAGGALLDVGSYTLAYAHLVFGRQPDSLAAKAHLGVTGVDEQTAIIGAYPHGALAVLTCAVRTSTVHDAWIHGSAGRIHIPDFWRATSAILWRDGKEPQAIAMPFAGNGYEYQAAEVARCVRAGRAGSELMPLAESLATMRTMDAVRAQIGLRYPMDADDEARATKGR